MRSMKDRVRDSATFLQSKIKVDPAQTVFVVLGSGFKPFADTIKPITAFECSEIPNFFAPRVAGHGARILIAEIDSRPCIIATGRIHMYEGYSADEAVFSLRVMASLGVRHAILTNAAGSVKRELKPGSAMAISDHINLTNRNCLSAEGKEFGPQFVDMVNAYDKQWRERIRSETNIVSGVYAGLLGPNYETPAETKMIGILGADAVGMSTVQETLAARQAGMKVCGLSLITNYAGGLSDSVDHHEVLETGKNAAVEMSKVLRVAIRTAF
jgi:purine-nucleoside phosphorylase